MGIETIAMIGFSLLQAGAANKQAKREAKAIVESQNIQNKNKALEISRKAANAKVSFLNSGVTLEGTPSLAISSIFNTGIEDINLASRNAETRAKNVISNARNESLANIGKTVIGGFAGSSYGAAVDDWLSSTAYGIQQDITWGLDPEAIGPFKPII